MGIGGLLTLSHLLDFRCCNIRRVDEVVSICPTRPLGPKAYELERGGGIYKLLPSFYKCIKSTLAKLPTVLGEVCESPCDFAEF